MAHDEDYLEQLEESASISADDMRRLEHLACKGDVDERYRVAAICANCFETKEQARRAERILMRLLKDQDKMVRVNACDSLCQSSSLRVMWQLLGLLADEEPLLRGYAAISLADISRKRSKWSRFIRNWANDASHSSRKPTKCGLPRRSAISTASPNRASRRAVSLFSAMFRNTPHCFPVRPSRRRLSNRHYMA